MNPHVRLIIAHQRAADLLRSANMARRVARPEDRRVKHLGPSYRLPGGSWIYRRRDSS